MSEIAMIRCDMCGVTRPNTKPHEKGWSNLNIRCGLELVPEVAAGKALPGPGYDFISGIYRDFCARCTKELVVPILDTWSEYKP